ncbi:MAG: MerR family transcriptional regulator [Blautia obeum]
MGNKEYLNVNELATLFGLKVQTLHYYEKSNSEAQLQSRKRISERLF